MENNGSVQNKKHYNHVHLLFTKKCFTDYRFTLGHSRKLFSFKFNQHVGLCGFFFSFQRKTPAIRSALPIHSSAQCLEVIVWTRSRMWRHFINHLVSAGGGEGRRQRDGIVYSTLQHFHQLQQWLTKKWNRQHEMHVASSTSNQPAPFYHPITKTTPTPNKVVELKLWHWQRGKGAELSNAKCCKQLAVLAACEIMAATGAWLRVGLLTSPPSATHCAAPGKYVCTTANKSLLLAFPGAVLVFFHSAHTTARLQRGFHSLSKLSLCFLSSNNYS